MVENTYLINRPKPGIIAKRVPDKKQKAPR